MPCVSIDSFQLCETMALHSIMVNLKENLCPKLLFSSTLWGFVES